MNETEEKHKEKEYYIVEYFYGFDWWGLYKRNDKAEAEEELRKLLDWHDSASDYKGYRLVKRHDVILDQIDLGVPPGAEDR